MSQRQGALARSAGRRAVTTAAPPGRPGTAARAWPAPLAGALLVLHVLAGAVLAVRQPWAISPDGTAYVDIARAWAFGRWSEALNGLWSPLYSWVLAVPVALGADPVVAGQLLQVIAGAAVLPGVAALMHRANVPALASRVVLPALAVVLLSWSVGGVGPDLLPLLACVWYLRIVLAEHPTRRSALAAGLVGGLGYLSKAAFLPLFVLTTVGLLVLDRRRGASWRTSALRCTGALTGFAVVALPWALALSIAYGHPTLGTSAGYNLAVVGPGHDSLAVLHPQDTSGLVAPPYAQATSAWTDPTTLPLPTWDVLSLPGLTHELRNVALNVGATTSFLLRFWVLALPALAWGLVRSARAGAGRSVRVLTLAGVVSSSVFLPWLVELRYLWPTCVVAVVLAGAAWGRWRARNRYPRFASVALVLGALTLVLQPVHHLLAGDQADQARQQARTVEALRALGVDGNVASSSPEGWVPDLSACYFLGAHYFGALSPLDAPQEQQRQLSEHRIDVLLVHGTAPVAAPPGWSVSGSVPGAALTVLRPTG